METIEYKNHTIEITQDDCLDSPREWENLGVIVAEHRRYTIGDEDHRCIKDEISELVSKYLTKDRKKLMQALKIVLESKSLNYLVTNLKDVDYKDYLIDAMQEADYSILFQLLDAIDEVYYLPVYMYDHSGICLNTSGFSCRWDSGQVGFIYVEKEKLIKEGLSDKSDSEILEYLRNEVKTYSQYLEGDVYHYSIEKDETDIDSCGGFYGYEECESEAKLIIDSIEKE
jgi:septum formation topological specificity factor MinE